MPNFLSLLKKRSCCAAVQCLCGGSRSGSLWNWHQGTWRGWLFQLQRPQNGWGFDPFLVAPCKPESFPTFFYVEREVVVAPLSQSLTILPVCCLFVGDEVQDGRVIGKFEDWVGTMFCNTVMVEQQVWRVLSTQPWGMPVLRVNKVEMRLPVLIVLVLPLRKSWIQSQMEGCSPRSRKNNDPFLIEQYTKTC